MADRRLAARWLDGRAAQRGGSYVAKARRLARVLASSLEENAGVFATSFQELCGRQPSGAGRMLSLQPQCAVVSGLDGVPTDDEVRLALSKLRNTAPGASGLPSVVWVALASTDAGFSLVQHLVRHFWTTEEVPVEWELGLLSILPKKGDLSQPGNYRGIMLLETAYKIVGNLLLARLKPIKEGENLDHEPQCGFRPERGTTDASFSLKQALRKRREHGQETWVLFIDLVKAFDRVPRELLWDVMLRYGVPPKLVSLLRALHATVHVQFEVGGVMQSLLSIIGVKQDGLRAAAAAHAVVVGAAQAAGGRTEVHPRPRDGQGDGHLPPRPRALAGARC